jgi:hypothetical protein
MFLFDATVPIDAVREVAQGSRQLPGVWHDMWPKLVAASLSSVAGFSITRLFTRFQDIDRRSQRLRLVSEASFTLQLREHLQSFCCEGAPWEIVERLKPQIDEFAQLHLRRVELALQIEAGEVTPTRAKNLLLRIFPFYPPAAPWLWIHHILYFIALGTLFFPIMGASTAATPASHELWVAVFGHNLLARWPNFLGALLAAALFAWLAYINEKALESTSPGESGLSKLHRSFRDRLLLCFQPHGKGMWAAHVAYLGYLGTVIRFIPQMLAHGAYADLATYIFILVLFPLFSFPAVVLNLASNFYDMKFALLAQSGDIAPERTTRKTGRLVRHLLLFEMPQRRWFWLFNVVSYFLLLVTIPTTLVQIVLCFAASVWWLTLILTPLQILPLVLLNSFVNFVNGILEIRSKAASCVAQAA